MLALAAILTTSLLAGGIGSAPVGAIAFATRTLIAAPAKKSGNLGFGIQFSLGYLATHSATTATSLNSELKLGYNTPLWQHRLDLQAIAASTAGATTAERYFGAAQSDRLLTQRSYLFGYLGYIHDRFSGYRYQSSVVIGYGISVVKTKAQDLKFELGAGYTRARNIMGDSENSSVVRGREAYNWQFSQNGSIVQSLTMEKSRFNLYSQFQLGVQAQLMNNLAFVLSYRAQHNANVPAGTPRTTTTLSLSVQYTLGNIFS
jgi:putative salt-induced outer membrane protein